MEYSTKYICLEPGRDHPAVCTMKFSATRKESFGQKMLTGIEYFVTSIEVLPDNMSLPDLVKHVKAVLDSSVMGNMSFVLGMTHLDQARASKMRVAHMHPARILLTDEDRIYKKDLTYYVPEKEIVDTMIRLWDDRTLLFQRDIKAVRLLDDDEDVFNCLGMVLWYAHNDMKKL